MTYPNGIEFDSPPEDYVKVPNRTFKTALKDEKGNIYHGEIDSLGCRDGRGIRIFKVKGEMVVSVGHWKEDSEHGTCLRIMADGVKLKGQMFEGCWNGEILKTSVDGTPELVAYQYG